MNAMEQQRNTVADAAEAFAKQELEHDLSGHDWWHVKRVSKMA